MLLYICIIPYPSPSCTAISALRFQISSIFCRSFRLCAAFINYLQKKSKKVKFTY